VFECSTPPVTQQQGHTNPNPSDIFIEDLIKHIHMLHNTDMEILVALNANKDMPCSIQQKT